MLKKCLLFECLTPTDFYFKLFPKIKEFIITAIVLLILTIYSVETYFMD